MAKRSSIKDESLLDATPSLTLSLKEKSKDILKSILQVSSHPPRWRNALSAIKQVIKQWGGSINGSLGNGSEFEFWVGDARFIVDGSHGGSDHTMMYAAQMQFMKKGLERAGITLDLLNAI